jgi:hypothetical protein
MKIDNTDKLKYLERMIQPYVKKNQKKYPIMQFLLGDGKELSGKFWEKKSSSRMAYDLYSWMQDDSKVLDFAFEYQLPGLKSGGNGPNMDVYIETQDELIFIESKFTEKANLHYMDNGYLKEAYYKDGPYGSNKMGLVKRFYDNQWAKRFSEFCEEWERTMESYHWHEGSDWFEPKQETCHLSGILLFLFNDGNKALIKDKSIRLYNIYWKLENDKESDMKKSFCEKAQQLINDIVSSNKSLGIRDFKIDAFTAQEMLKTPGRLSSHIRFPKELCEIITKRNEKILDEANVKSR